MLPVRKLTCFLFVNSKSGGEKGKHFLTVPRHRLDYETTNRTAITLFLVNLFDDEEREQGLARMQQLVAKGEREVKVIVCGGDGTVVWVV